MRWTLRNSAGSGLRRTLHESANDAFLLSVNQTVGGKKSPLLSICNVQPYSSSAPEPTSVISLSCRLFSFTIHSSAGEPGQYCKTLRTTASPVEKRSGGYGYTNGILAALRLLYHIGSFENVKKTPFSIKII